MTDLTPIFEAVITLIVALITVFVIPWIKSKIDAEKLAKIQYWVTVAVEAAEQMYTGSGRGDEKLAYVEEFLKSKGFKLSTETLRALIEAAVLNLPVELGIAAIEE